MLKELLPYLFSKKNNNYLKMSFAILLDFITTAINVGAPAVFVDRLSGDSSGEKGDLIKENYLLIIAGGLMLVAQSLPKVKGYLLDSVRSNVQKELTKSLLERTFELDLDYYINTPNGALFKALSNNYSSVEEAIPSFYGGVLPFTIDVTAISGYLIYRFGSIGVSPVVILVAALLLSIYSENRNQPQRAACAKLSFDTYGQLSEEIRNYELIHQFGLVEHTLQKLNTKLIATEESYKKTRYQEDSYALVFSLLNGFGFFGSVLIFFFLSDKSIDMASFALFLYYMTRFNFRLDTVPVSINSFRKASTDFDTISGYLTKRPTIVDPARPLHLMTAMPLQIEFRNVTCTMDGKTILSNISFKLEPKSVLAIVGPSGSGKSTIIKVLLRFYPISLGVITINGIDICELSLKSLRDAVAVVTQQALIIDARVSENIRLGDLKATDDEVTQAAILSDLVPSNNLGKLNEMTGKDGGRLSGGEKQRILLARALLKGGQALVLDEATSALDPTTATGVEETLGKLERDTTTLIITHRMSSTVRAGLILYLERGEIKERGSFDDLVRREGLFYRQLQVECLQLGLSVSDIRPPLAVPSLTPTTSRNIVAFWNRRVLREASEIDTASADGSLAAAQARLL